MSLKTILMQKNIITTYNFHKIGHDMERSSNTCSVFICCLSTKLIITVNTDNTNIYFVHAVKSFVHRNVIVST